MVQLNAEGLELGQRLGSGPTGRIHAATSELDHAVVVKLLHDDLAESPELRQRFIEAAERLRDVRHPNVGQVLSVHDDPDVEPAIAYYVTPNRPGRPLDVECRRRTFSVEVACEVGVQICLGLLACDEQGLTHCNLKPSNVWVWQDANGVLRAQLLDVGVTAAVYDDPLAPHAARWAQEVPRYQAPELLLGHTATCRADVYSVGAILYELLCGHPVIDETDELQALKAVMCGQWLPLVERNPNLPETLVRAVEAALVVSPEDRFSSCRQFMRQLLAHLPADSPVAAEASAWVARRSAHTPVPTDPAGSSRAQAPKHRFVSAIPSGQLLSPVFPKSPPAPRFSRAPAPLPPAPAPATSGSVSAARAAVDVRAPSSQGRMDLVAVCAGLGIGAALVWLQVVF